jgi:hypothetical protein
MIAHSSELNDLSYETWQPRPHLSSELATCILITDLTLLYSCILFHSAFPPINAIQPFFLYSANLFSTGSALSSKTS